MGAGKKKVMVTGSAGFIGSHLAEALREKYVVHGIDNFSSGNIKSVPTIHADLLTDAIDLYFSEIDTVFHLAANPDVKFGAISTKTPLEQNVLVTYNVLEAMRRNNVKKIVFASSSTVYGNAKTPTPEEYSPLEPASIYGASKLACEALICAYCHMFGMQAWVFRLANILGQRSNHGIIPDFIQKLRTNARSLEILGDGEQNKSYLYIGDCISAILSGFEKSSKRINIFNVGSDDQMKVIEIANLICKEMNVVPKYEFSGGAQGWKGDVPVMMLDTARIKSLGWKANYNSREAVKKTICEILTS